MLRCSLYNFLKQSNLIKSSKYNFKCQRYASTRLDELSNEDKPITYSKSPASRWKAESSFTGTDSKRLWYEPYVVLGSIAAFMIYFCVLREESDVDQNFEQTIYNRIKGLEEQQLIILLKYNRNHGLETKQIEERLREIAAIEQNVKKD